MISIFIPVTLRKLSERMQDIHNLRGELVRRGTSMKVAYKVYNMFNVKRFERTEDTFKTTSR